MAVLPTWMVQVPFEFTLSSCPEVLRTLNRGVARDAFSVHLLDYNFKLLRTIHTGIVAVAEWYNFRIPTVFGPEPGL